MPNEYERILLNALGSLAFWAAGGDADEGIKLADRFFDAAVAEYAAELMQSGAQVVDMARLFPCGHC